MAGISSKAAGSLSNKKRYNSYEFNSDFDLSLYESFYRIQDPQIGRFWQIDPKAEKYYCLSSYVGMADNPISIYDILGDDLELTGKSKNVKKAIDVINRIFDGYYTASVDKNGKVVLTENHKEGEASKQASGLFKVMKSVVDNTNGTASIEIVNKDPRVDVDSWDRKQIDISDVEKFGNGTYANTASMLGHAFAEQESLQIENKDNPTLGTAEYYRDHNKGEKAEELITGYERATENHLSLYQNIRGNTTGALGLNYVQTAKGSDGKDKYQNYHVDIKFKNGNVTKVTSGRGVSKL